MSDLVQPKSFEPTYTPTYGPEVAAAVQRTAEHVAPIRESMSRAWEPADLEGRPADFVTRISDTLATFSYRDFLGSKIYPGDTLAVAERNAAGYARSVGLPEPPIPKSQSGQVITHPGLELGIAGRGHVSLRYY